MGREIKLNEKIWEEFREKKAVINCRTKEEVEEFIKILNKEGYDKTNINAMRKNWNRYKNNTCYSNVARNVEYCYENWYIEEGYKVYTYKELTTLNKTPNIVTNIKHIKNGRATIVEVNGKKGIAKCHEEEIHNQDDIVGFTLAYCRAMGITVEDLIHRLEKSGVVEKKDQKQEFKIIDGHLIVKQDEYEVGDRVVYSHMFGIFNNVTKIGEITGLPRIVDNYIMPWCIDGKETNMFTMVLGKIVGESVFEKIPTDSLLEELKRRTEKQIG